MVGDGAVVEAEGRMRVEEDALVVAVAELWRARERDM